MKQLVSKLINRIITNGELQFDDAANTVSYTGTMVYHVERRGYFSIEDDLGNRYFPFNSKQFPKLLKDRLRVRFTLECYPDVPNYYGDGLSARIVKLERDDN